MSVETDVAQGASAVLNMADALAPLALAETGGSAFVIPAAGLCLVAMLDGAALPGGLGDAAVHWAQTGEKLDEAKKKLKEVTDAIPDDAWTSDDRDAFNKKIEQLGIQLETARVFADAVGTALIVSGTVLAAYGAFIAIIGTELFVQAMMILAEAASVVGDFGPVEAQEAEANATAVEIAENIENTNNTLKTVSKATAAVLGGAEALHTLVQIGEGNDQAFGDALRGSAVALPEIALSALLGKGAEKGAGKLLGKVFGKDLGEAAKEAGAEAADAVKDSGAAKAAAHEADVLAGKAAKAAKEDFDNGAPHAVTQTIAAGKLLEEAGRTGEKASAAAAHATAKTAEATAKSVDAVGHNVFKKGAEKAGEAGGQWGGTETGKLIDKLLNGDE
jgi:hypothetical protein